MDDMHSGQYMIAMMDFFAGYAGCIYNDTFIIDPSRDNGTPVICHLLKSKNRIIL